MRLTSSKQIQPHNQSILVLKLSVAVRNRSKKTAAAALFIKRERENSIVVTGIKTPFLFMLSLTSNRVPLITVKQMLFGFERGTISINFNNEIDFPC